MNSQFAIRQPGFRSAVRELARAQKPGAGVGAYTRYVNRPLGRIAAAFAYCCGLSANAVTAISGVCSLAAILLLALVAPSWWVGLLAGFGLLLGYVLDSADGQLARLRGGGSLAGEWLDHVIDAGRMPALHIGVLIALFRFHSELPSGYLLLPLAFLLVGVVRFFALILAEQMRRQRTGSGAPARGVSATAARSLLALPGDFGLLCLVFLCWAALPVFLALYGLLFVANALLLVPSLSRRYVELREA